MPQDERGQILPIVILSLLVLTIFIFGLVNWIQTDTNLSVKEQKSTTAINFAEAGIDRGAWKLQSSTGTWATAAAGTIIAGYNFDTTYTDIPGGTYRIKFTNGTFNGLSAVTVTAEGRDALKREVRALAVVYTNQTIYSGMMSGGNVNWSDGLGVYWGPIISQGNITLADDNIARRYFPQKYAKGVVIGTANYPRDTNGLLPPNTDNVEWWSNYAGVPNVPILDFVTLRSSAAATGTLNVYGCGCAAVPQYTVNGTTVAAWDTRTPDECANPYPPPGTADVAPHTTHFGNSTHIYNVLGLDPNQNYVWYWDGDVTLEGYGYNGTLATSLRGTVVVRGNLTINSSGDMVYIGQVPPDAWKQEQKLLIDTYDTAASGEYPADIGYHQSATTWHFGVDSWNEPGLGTGWVNTVGIQGFVYVGGDLNITSFLDINGAVWVNGNINSNYANASSFCGIFYDETLSVPALNVILMRQSWQDVAPSSTPWP